MMFYLKNDVITDFIETLTFWATYVTFDGNFWNFFDTYPQKGLPIALSTCLGHFLSNFSTLALFKHDFLGSKFHFFSPQNVLFQHEYLRMDDFHTFSIWIWWEGILAHSNEIRYKQPQLLPINDPRNISLWIEHQGLN